MHCVLRQSQDFLVPSYIQCNTTDHQLQAAAYNILLLHIICIPVDDSKLTCAMYAVVGAGIGGLSLSEHERNRHSGTGTGGGSGSQFGSQGTDSFNNPQAPVSHSGAAVYNADGQAVGTGSTSLTPGQTVSTTSGRPSAYDSAANPGSRADTNRSGGGVASHIPGTQSYRETQNTRSG